MTTYSEAVEQTITAGEQIHQIVNGTATTEVTVEDGSKVPSIRKALLDNFYFKDPIAWQAGQTENVFNQLRQFTDGSWWYAPSATASNPISMGSTPVGDPLWKIYSFDAIGKLEPRIDEALRRSYAEAGYTLVDGSFESGGTLVNANDVLLQERTGKAFTGPAGTVAAGTVPSGPNYINRGDETLRSDLANPDKGAALVARGVVAVDSIADLMALPAGQRKEGLRYLVKGYHVGSDVGGGEFYWDSASTEAANGGTVIAASGVPTGRWKRTQSLSINASDFGITNRLGSIDRSVLSDAINALPAGSTFVFDEEGVYDLGVVTHADNAVNISKKNGIHIIVPPHTAVYAECDPTNPFDSGVFNFYDCYDITLSGGGMFESKIIADTATERRNSGTFWFRPSDLNSELNGSSSPNNITVKDLKIKHYLDDALVYNSYNSGYNIRVSSLRHPLPKGNGLTVTGCNFDGSTGRIIQTASINNVKVLNNSFKEVGKNVVTVPIRIIGSYSGAIISNNFITSADQSYITAFLYIGTQDVNAATEKVGSSNDIIISNNFVSHSGVPGLVPVGLRITSSKNVLVEGNTLAATKGGYLFDIYRPTIEIESGEELSDVVIKNNVFSGWSSYFTGNYNTGVSRVHICDNIENDLPPTPSALAEDMGFFIRRKTSYRGFSEGGASVDINFPYAGVWKITIDRLAFDSDAANGYFFMKLRTSTGVVDVRAVNQAFRYSGGEASGISQATYAFISDGFPSSLTGSVYSTAEIQLTTYGRAKGYTRGSGNVYHRYSAIEADTTESVVGINLYSSNGSSILPFHYVMEYVGAR